MMRKTIWIDLDNAPHVPFFMPLVRHLRQEGHRVLITVRDFGYTRELLDMHDTPYELIGRHPGKSSFQKVLGLIRRTLALFLWVRRKRVDCAASHGSRAMVLAAALLRIPCTTMYDYEHVSTGIFNRLSARVLLPDALPDDLLHSVRLPYDRLRKYPGLKEEIYLGDFAPEPGILNQIGANEEDILIVLRPPATSAHYHNPVSDFLFQTVLDRISVSDNTTGIIVPRTPEQGESLMNSLKKPLKFRILTRSVNGLNLIWHSDLVVGGGGTMNREAALMGRPVYSIFMGKPGTIDRLLCERGQLSMVRSVDDVTRIKFTKRDSSDNKAQLSTWRERSRSLTDFIAKELILAAETR